MGIGSRVGVRVGVPVGVSIGVSVGRAVSVAAMATCTVDFTSGVKVLTQPADSKLIKIRKRRSPFIFPLSIAAKAASGWKCGALGRRVQWLIHQVSR